MKLCELKVWKRCIVNTKTGSCIWANNLLLLYNESAGGGAAWWNGTQQLMCFVFEKQLTMCFVFQARWDEKQQRCVLSPRLTFPLHREIIFEAVRWQFDWHGNGFRIFSDIFWFLLLARADGSARYKVKFHHQRCDHCNKVNRGADDQVMIVGAHMETILGRGYLDALDSW